MQIIMPHAARQLPSWLIFDVGQNTMKPKSVTLASLYAIAAISLAGAPSRQTFPDGSVVQLESNAKIAIEFSDAVRGVALQDGAASFWIAKDQHRPFVVRSGNLAIRAVGTAFTVFREAHRVSVEVTEGRVAVASTRHSAAGSSSLRSMNTVLVQPGGPIAVWDFSDVPLAEVISHLNRHAAASLVIRDVALANLRISITMLAGSIDPMLRLLGDEFGIESERQGDTIYLKKDGAL
jgi:transmembrane sensor